MTPESEYQAFSTYQLEERQDAPRHVGEVLHSIIAGWPADQREKFYSIYAAA